MQDLQTLIDQLEKKRKLHISIFDFGGILDTPNTKIDFKNVIHSKEFCNIAKSTERGYRTCLRCKMLANKKAITQRQPFCGQCSYGLCEAAVPVIIEKNVVAIVYVGNAVVDKGQTAARIKRTCRYTGVSAEALCNRLADCELINDPIELHRIADIVSDYLKMLYAAAPKAKAELHWLVSSMKRFADERFCYNISLREFAITHQRNEKYIGRLFKKEMGISFNEYRMDLQLCKAAHMLSQSSDKIIDIALDCGFGNVSYFNRSFQRRFGMSPSRYRKEFRANNGGAGF